MCYSNIPYSVLVCSPYQLANMDLSISYIAISFCLFFFFEAVLWSVYKFRIVISSWKARWINPFIIKKWLYLYLCSLSYCLILYDINIVIFVFSISICMVYIFFILLLSTSLDSYLLDGSLMKRRYNISSYLESQLFLDRSFPTCNYKDKMLPVHL